MIIALCGSSCIRRKGRHAETPIEKGGSQKMMTRRAFLTDPVQVHRKDRSYARTRIQQFGRQSLDDQLGKDITEKQSGERNVTAQNIELRKAIASLRRSSENEHG
jgi:hypothetical protein